MYLNYKMDTINFKHIHFKFGKENLKQYPIIGPLKKLYYTKICKIQTIYPLNYIEYQKKKKQRNFEKNRLD